MQTTQSTTQHINQIHDEMILVVKRAEIFSIFPAWHGLAQEPLEHALEVIKNKKEFQPRSTMETDPSYKQIIPYLIFNHDNRYFFMQRQGHASEQRLKNKYTLGIGGHIRLEDMSTDSIFEWAKREFHEEVNYNGELQIETIGILNDDTNAVGQVHIGLVLLLKGDNSDISVKSELKSGTLLTLQELQPFVEHMESWSQMVFEKLV